MFLSETHLHDLKRGAGLRIRRGDVRVPGQGGQQAPVEQGHQPVGQTGG